MIGAAALRADGGMNDRPKTAQDDRFGAATRRGLGQVGGKVGNAERTEQDVLQDRKEGQSPSFTAYMPSITHIPRASQQQNSCCVIM